MSRAQALPFRARRLHEALRAISAALAAPLPPRGPRGLSLACFRSLLVSSPPSHPSQAPTSSHGNSSAFERSYLEPAAVAALPHQDGLAGGSGHPGPPAQGVRGRGGSQRRPLPPGRAIATAQTRGASRPLLAVGTTPRGCPIGTRSHRVPSPGAGRLISPRAPPLRGARCSRGPQLISPRPLATFHSPGNAGPLPGHRAPGHRRAGVRGAQGRGRCAARAARCVRPLPGPA